MVGWLASVLAVGGKCEEGSSELQTARGDERHRQIGGGCGRSVGVVKDKEETIWQMSSREVVVRSVRARNVGQLYAA